MRQLIDELEILGKYEQPRILLIDQLTHCHISLQAGRDHYAVQSWSAEDVELLVVWLGKWLAAETGNATFEAECATLRTQLDHLRAALAAATARAEAAEAKLAFVDEYGEDQWNAGWRWDDAHRPDDVPVSFAEWLAQQSEVQP